MYSRETKNEVLKMARSTNANQAAAYYGISQTTVANWKKQKANAKEKAMAQKTDTTAAKEQASPLLGAALIGMFGIRFSDLSGDYVKVIGNRGTASAEVRKELAALNAVVITEIEQFLAKYKSI